MAVGYHAVQKLDVQKITGDGDLLVERIRKSLARFDRVLQGREAVIAQNGKSRAGASYRHAILDGRIDARFYRSALPEVNVIILAAAGDKQSGGAANLLRDERLRRALARSNDQGRDGADGRANFLDVPIVGVSS